MISRALLLTDIVDSTSVAASIGELRTRKMWAAHDRAARALQAEWCGVEMEKTDGLLLIFGSVSDAVGFACGYHRALAAIDPPLRSRVGVHVADFEVRENEERDIERGAAAREVVGIAKPILARVMATAVGGQTLMTADARLSLGVTAWKIQSHGWFRLKGLAEAFELFEVGDSGSPFIPPPDGEKVYRVVAQGDIWRPLRSVEHNLPAERDGFVGRREALQALAGKLERGSRLVSVLGTGGSGKTRLVTRFAWTWLGDFPGGAWFCDLSAATTLDGIFFAVARGLGVPLGKTDPSVQLAHAIASRGQCLIVLDNFEQVARYSEETIGQWLDHAAQPKFVVTTREVLGISGEDILALGPMNAEDGQALFVRRAEAVRPLLTSNEDDAGVTAQLVKVLDGLPLAIELAAARIRVMSPRTLLSRMNERFRLLGPASGRRDRQATLRATFDWSWDLLNLFERMALAQLSVFEGGFTVASAEAVVDFGSIADSPWMLDILQALVDKSFVRQLRSDRFDLLESIREYAHDHLITEGRFPGSSRALAEQTSERHFSYFANVDDAFAISDDGVELNNLVAACRRACQARNPKAAVGTLTASWAGLQLHGPFRTAMRLVHDVESAVVLDILQQAQVDWIAASALDNLGQRDTAIQRTTAGLAKASALADRRLEGRFLCRMGEQLAASDPNGALASLERAETMSLEIGDLQLQGLALSALGNVLLHLGRPELARERYQEALGLAQRVGDERQHAGVLGNLGILLFGECDFEGAQETFERCVAILRRIGDRRWEGNMRCNLGMVHIELRRFAQALVELEQALALARSLGHARLECTALCNLGIAAESSGDLVKARRSYEAAISLAAELKDPRSEGQFRGYLGLLLVRTGRLDDGIASLASGERLLLDASDQWNLGLLLCQSAEASRLCGRVSDAINLLGRVQSIIAATHASPTSELGKAFATTRCLLPEQGG